MRTITKHVLVASIYALKEKRIFSDAVAMDIKFPDVPHHKFTELISSQTLGVPLQHRVCIKRLKILIS